MLASVPQSRAKPKRMREHRRRSKSLFSTNPEVTTETLDYQQTVEGFCHRAEEMTLGRFCDTVAAGKLFGEIGFHGDKERRPLSAKCLEDAGAPGVEALPQDPKSAQEFPVSRLTLWRLRIAGSTFWILPDTLCIVISKDSYLKARRDDSKRVEEADATIRHPHILGDGSVVTWGHHEFRVKVQLENVVDIQASFGAFAAILADGSAVRCTVCSTSRLLTKPLLRFADGSVVTWGDARRGGDSTSVKHQLQNVRHVQASCAAFAAIRADGSVVTWGDAMSGGGSSEVQGQLQNVLHIQASHGAFAAIRADRSVVSWGNCVYGGDSSAVKEQLHTVLHIQASCAAFAAIRADGSVVTWGSARRGGDSSVVKDRLQHVSHIQASKSAFAAIRADGSVVTWGDAVFGGDSSEVQGQLQNVLHIQASGPAFAAIRADGSVVTWGHATSGGDSSAVKDRLQNVQQIQASDRAFAAILADGSVVTWGDAFSGGDSTSVQDRLQHVVHIQASHGAFAAIRRDGSVVTWGNAKAGGDSSRERLAFLGEHLPGMREALASGGEKEKTSPKGKASSPFAFRQATYSRGHVFLKQGEVAEDITYVVVSGFVEFQRHELMAPQQS
eukprot:s6298_g1.t1